MRTCSNCGERLPEDGVAFCPNCGEPIRGELSARKFPGKWRPAAVIALAVAALLVVGAAAAKLLPDRLSGGEEAGSGSSISLDILPPEEKFIQLQERLMVDQLSAWLEAGETVSGKFSSDLTLWAEVDNARLQAYLEDTSLTLKAAAESQKLLFNARLTLMGSPVLSGDLTLDQGMIGFYLPQADPNYYTVDLETLAKGLGREALPLAVLRLPDLSWREWRALAQSYMDIVYTVVAPDSVTMETGQKIELEELASGFEGTLYTFTPRGEDVEAALLKLAGRLETDQHLRSLVLELFGQEALRQLLSAGAPDGLEEDLEQVLQEVALELRDRAAGIAADMERSGFTWTLGVEDETVRLIRLSWQAEGEAYTAAFACSEQDGTVRQVLRLTRGGEVLYRLQYDHSQNGDTAKGLIGFQDGDTPMSVWYEVDRSKRSPLGLYCGKYVLDMTLMTESNMFLELEVTETEDGADHVLTVNAASLYSFDEMFRRLSITLHASRTGTASPPEAQPVDISGWSQEKLAEQFARLEQTLRRAWQG